MSTGPRRTRDPRRALDDPLTFLNDLARLATQDPEFRPMLQRLTDAIAERLGIELVALVSIDRAAGRFVCEALTTELATDIRIGYGRVLGSGVVGQVAATGEPIAIDDANSFPGFVAAVDGVVSELCLPIKHHGEVIALLNLESPRFAAFRGQLPLFSAVADHLSGAIATARLYEETRRRAFYLEVLTEVSRIALAPADLPEVLSRITQHVQERFELAIVAIVVATESGSEWEHRAISMRPGVVMMARKRWPVTAGVVGRAIRTGEPQLVLDTTSDADFFGLDRNIRCEYVVPLQFQGRIRGAFNVESYDPAVLSPANLAFFRTLAEQMVGPIELALVNQKLQRANAELAALARRDPLTGVANRRQFDETLDAEWRRARRARAAVGLVLVDVDCFKSYNDACGHQTGDACLQKVAQALSAVAHRAGDLVARYGGEEFGVILPGLDAEQTATLAESMRRAVEELAVSHPASSVAGVVTVSAGASSRRPQKGDSPAILIRETDVALYRAKSAGRNRVEKPEEAVG